MAKNEKWSVKKKMFCIFLILISVTVLLIIPGVLLCRANHFGLRMSIPDSEEITIGYGDSYEQPTVTAAFRGDHLLKKGIDAEVTEEGTVDAAAIGTYTETYSASFLWMKAQAIRTIHVTDQTPPMLTISGEGHVYVDQDAEWVDPGYSASDAIDGDLTAQVKIEGSVDTSTVGDYTLVYSVSDAAGNQDFVSRTVTVEDVTPPVITLEGKEEMSVKLGSEFTDPGYTASDNVDGEVTVKVEGSVDTSAAGTYTLTYSATDTAGNTTSVTRKVIVYKPVVKSTSVPGNKVVYLTFDDGPGAYTQQLLDVLDKYGAKATFFVTNQFPKYQSMIAKEAAAGHTVAVHTYSHDYATIYASTDAFYADIDKMSAIIKKQTGTTPTILRFPGGSSNAVSKKYCTGIMTSLTESIEAHGYVYCDWNVDSEDAGGAKTADEVAENIIAGIQKHNVSYVLQHDIKSFSVDAVEKVLQWGQENGYTFLPLTDSTTMYHHHVNN